MTKLRRVFPSSQNIQLGRVFLWTVICMPRNTCLGILSSKYFSFLFCFSCVCAWVSVCVWESVCVHVCVCVCMPVCESERGCVCRIVCRTLCHPENRGTVNLSSWSTLLSHSRQVFFQPLPVSFSLYHIHSPTQTRSLARTNTHMHTLMHTSFAPLSLSSTLACTRTQNNFTFSSFYQHLSVSLSVLDTCPLGRGVSCIYNWVSTFVTSSAIHLWNIFLRPFLFCNSRRSDSDSQRSTASPLKALFTESTQRRFLFNLRFSTLMQWYIKPNVEIKMMRPYNSVQVILFDVSVH